MLQLFNWLTTFVKSLLNLHPLPCLASSIPHEARDLTPFSPLFLLTSLAFPPHEHTRRLDSLFYWAITITMRIIAKLSLAAAAAAVTLWSETTAFQLSSSSSSIYPLSSIVRRSVGDSSSYSNAHILHAIAIKDNDISNNNNNNEEEEEVATIQILMSDTGGGHRASANALRDAFTTLYETKYHPQPNNNNNNPPIRIVCDIVDIYTEYGPFPYNQFVPAYKFMAEYSFLWKWAYDSGGTPFGLWVIDVMCELVCFNPFMECMMRSNNMMSGLRNNNNNNGSVGRSSSSSRADMVISVHPLCQSIPLKILTYLDTDGTSRTQGRTTPFVTVVTDLGGAHPSWFNPGVDKCFVPSDVLRNCALDRKVRDNQIVQYGLPIRRGFWGSSSSSKVVNEIKTNVDDKHTIRQSLGLENLPTVLIVGGGDGMGGIVKQALAVGERLQKLASVSVSSSNKELAYQLVVVCGNNKAAQTSLSPNQMDWGSNINVHIHGFVNNMDEFMRASDILVTKAGPGTIAEASICGLPCILSSFLPGQEEGNVDYVVDAGFGCYQSNPEGIADTVEEWLANSAAAATTTTDTHDTSNNMLERMKSNALIASRPDATMDIARDLADMLYKRREDLKTKKGKNTISSSSSQVSAAMMAK